MNGIAKQKTEKFTGGDGGGRGGDAGGREGKGDVGGMGKVLGRNRKIETWVIPGHG